MTHRCVKTPSPSHIPLSLGGAGTSFGEFGASLLQAAIASSDRKHAADAEIAVLRIRCKGKMDAIRAPVIQSPLERIHFKGHKSAATEIRRNHSLFAAQHFIADPDWDPPDAISADFLAQPFFSHFYNPAQYDMGSLYHRTSGNTALREIPCYCSHPGTSSG